MQSTNISILLKFIGSIALLEIIVLYPIIAYTIYNGVGFSYIITSLIFSLPVLAIAILLPERWMFCLLTTIITIGSIIELTMVDLYHDFLLPGGIISTLWTNSHEASEFFWTNLSEAWHWLPLIALFVGTCWLYQRPKIDTWLYVGVMILCLLPIIFVTYKLRVYYAGNGTPITLRYYMNNRVWNRPPYNVTYAFVGALRTLQQRKMIENAQQMSFGAKRDKIPSQKEVYVLAIGESLRYENVSLNGIYPRKTTPRLESLNNLILFDNYYSQACLTMFSVPMLITRATPLNYELNYAEPSITEPYKECGFATYVIASGTNLLSYETYLSKEADSLIVVPNIVENGKILSGDRTIVHIIDSLVQCHDKLFVICQFLGNHSFYSNYEQEFDVYHPNSNDKGVERRHETLINAYDNSILYTDYILSSIITSINRPHMVSAFLFASDHGENIGESGGGHGGSSYSAKSEYHVPLIFWWSDEYAALFPENITQARQHQHARINGDCIFYTANTMGGDSLGFNF